MSHRVLGVLGGMDIDDDRLIAWANSAEHVYAADSGADRLIRLGFSPTVVGDFDSFQSLPNASHLRLVQSLDQESTDCDKLLSLVALDGFDSITIICTEGDLPDHVVATYSSCIASPLQVRFAFRRGIGWLLKSGGSLSVKTQQGQRVSLVPFAACEGVTIEGVAWPLIDEPLQPGGKVSVSNEAAGDQVSAQVKTGAALLFVETHEVSW